MEHTPAIAAFVSEMGEAVVFGQVRIVRHGNDFEIQHCDQSDVARQIPVAELRTIADTTAAGAYRPLKSAPTLRDGWRCVATSLAELETALNHLYPGGVADWHASRNGAPGTSYREHMERQTGMYRIANRLDADGISEVAAACCHESFCLKSRHWDADGPRENPGAGIPCLEPCAVLMEFARKAARISQEDRVPVSLSDSELESLLASLENSQPAADDREADFQNPRNPRRLALLKNKLMRSRPQKSDE